MISVVTHLEPDILECEVKWALGSTTVHKASRCDEIPAELFKSLKDDAIKVMHSFCQLIWKTQSGHKTGKCQPSSQSPRRVVPKNVLTIGQSHSSPMLVRSSLKSCIPGFSIMWTKNFQMSRLGLEKEEELEIKLQTFAGLERKQGNFRKNIYLCFIDYAKAFDCVDYDKLWKALREMGIPDHFTCLLRNLYGTTDWLEIEEGIHQSCLLSPCLLNTYAEHIMRNAGLDEL